MGNKIDFQLDGRSYSLVLDYPSKEQGRYMVQARVYLSGANPNSLSYDSFMISSQGYPQPRAVGGIAH
jgi:hypothetical protein